MSSAVYLLVWCNQWCLVGGGWRSTHPPHFLLRPSRFRIWVCTSMMCMLKYEVKCLKTVITFLGRVASTLLAVHWALLPILTLWSAHPPCSQRLDYSATEDKPQWENDHCTVHEPPMDQCKCMHVHCKCSDCLLFLCVYVSVCVCVYVCACVCVHVCKRESRTEQCLWLSNSSSDDSRTPVIFSSISGLSCGFHSSLQTMMVRLKIKRFRFYIIYIKMFNLICLCLPSLFPSSLTISLSSILSLSRFSVL